jgi:hypothetical protein
MLSHELAHMFAAHAPDEISKGIAAMGALLPVVPFVPRVALWVLRIATIGPWTKTMMAYGLAVVGFWRWSPETLNGWENEAVIIFFRLLMNAGYDHKHVAEFWQRVAKFRDEKIPRGKK